MNGNFTVRWRTGKPEYRTSSFASQLHRHHDVFSFGAANSNSKVNCICKRRDTAYTAATLEPLDAVLS